ncbi:MAG: LacI family transcriptional regulator, partial [Chloroflexota bacterium]|nr:LacI family transcriptional regulator [Chloroflexota bacterium]
MPRATIADVARRAKVSKTAVSFAFNDPSQLSADTVERIKAAAVELGYAPHPVARTMTTKRTGVIGILLPQPVHVVLANPFYPLLLQGIGGVCDEQAYSLMLVSPVCGSVEAALSRAAVDGYISIGMDESQVPIALILRREMPIVLLDSGQACGAAPHINVDDLAGARDVARHLLELGHTEILVLGIHSGDPRSPLRGIPRVRLVGYRRAFEDAGVLWSEENVRLVASTRRAGREAALEALGKKRYTAVLAQSDILALGAYDAAAALGMSVPSDLSVAGFDGLRMAELLCPQLTTVQQPAREKAAHAAKLLLQALHGRRAES